MPPAPLRGWRYRYLLDTPLPPVPPVRGRIHAALVSSLGDVGGSSVGVKGGLGRDTTTDEVAARITRDGAWRDCP